MTADAQSFADAGAALLVQHAPSAAAVVAGVDHRLVYTNAAFSALAAEAGRVTTPVACGVPIADVFVPAASRALVNVLDAVRRSGEPASGAMPVVPRADAPGADAPGAAAASADAWPCTAWPIASSVPPTAVRIVAMIDASRAAARTRVQHRDVTERVLLSAFRQEERADAADAGRAAAEAVNVERARLLARTSHDLRTPLQAIGAYTELIELGVHGPVTDGQHAALHRIQQAMRHMLEITAALLTQTRQELGQVGPAVTDVSVATALDAAAALVAPQATAQGITLTVVPDAARLVVRADPGKLRQVLVNLLANAVKFTAAGGTVTMSSAAEPGRVVIRVDDTGDGIAPDQIARIFDPYVQVGERRATPGAGAGLGLTISRGLVRDMAGDLTVVSTLGVGSTFTVALPHAP